MACLKSVRNRRVPHNYFHGGAAGSRELDIDHEIPENVRSAPSRGPGSRHGTHVAVTFRNAVHSGMNVSGF